MSKHWWNYYTSDKILEAEEPTANQAPQTDPSTGESGTVAKNDQDSSQQFEPNDNKQSDSEDVSNDPKHPDMPEHDEDKDFEDWKNELFKLSIKGEAQELIDFIKKVRDRDLDATQHKFVEDNLEIQWFRQDANINKLSNTVRKLIKQQIDKNYPGTSLMQHIVKSLNEMPQVNEIFHKLPGFYGMKGDLHRKFIAAILCGIQVGGGGSREDIIYNEKNYSINISTRISTEWGEISIGKWALQIDDPERYLEEPELARMKDGSPEERIVLRHRIVISSIAERFKTRSFMIHVVGSNGTIHCLAWDLGDSLISGYQSGKLVVRTKASEAAEGMIDDDGNVIPISDLTIRYIKETGKKDDTGMPYKHEVEFLERINGMLYLTADLETIRDMTNMQGVFFYEIPFNGNKSDLKMLLRNHPSLNELLLRRT